MRHFKMVINRGSNVAPIQSFSHDLMVIQLVARAHLSQLPPKHRAVITEITEDLVGTVDSKLSPEGLRVYEENFLDSTPKVEETSKVTEVAPLAGARIETGKEQTQSGNNT